MRYLEMWQLKNVVVQMKRSDMHVTYVSKITLGHLPWTDRPDQHMPMPVGVINGGNTGSEGIYDLTTNRSSVEML